MSRKRNLVIDLLKSFAILSVILLHSISLETRNLVLGPLHILHAVPLFMMISGINFTESLNRDIRGGGQFSRWFRRNVNRIFWPYLVIYILEICYYFIAGEVTLRSAIVLLFTGASGPGSYYIPLLVQLFIVLPLLFAMTKKKANLTLVIVFIASLGFEYLMFYYQVPNAVYRLLLFRFLLPLELGIYYVIKSPKIRPVWLVLGVLSLCYIIGVEYFSLQSFSQPDWRSQNTLAFFYPFLILLILMPIKLENISSLYRRFLIMISQATYHIFLVQMIYFGFPGVIIQRWLTLPIYIIFSVLLCVFLGILFFYVDTIIRKIIRTRK